MQILAIAIQIKHSEKTNKTCYRLPYYAINKILNIFLTTVVVITVWEL